MEVVQPRSGPKLFILGLLASVMTVYPPGIVNEFCGGEFRPVMDKQPPKRNISNGQAKSYHQPFVSQDIPELFQISQLTTLHGAIK